MVVEHTEGDDLGMSAGAAADLLLHVMLRYRSDDDELCRIYKTITATNSNAAAHASADVSATRPCRVMIHVVVDVTVASSFANAVVFS